MVQEKERKDVEIGCTEGCVQEKLQTACAEL